MANIVCSDLSFSWPDGTPVVANLTLSFGQGRTGLIGRNGSGKSTLLRLLAGELTPLSGSIHVEGTPAYLPQSLTLRPTDDVAGLLGISAKLDALRAVQSGSADERYFQTIGDDWDLEEQALAALDRLGLFPHLPKDGDALRRPVGELSGGEAMAAALAGIVIRKPAATLLDEPTNNLDSEARAWLYGEVERWRGTLVVVSHDRDLLERMDSIAELRNGEVRLYGGNYSRYCDQSATELAAAERRVRDAEAKLRREKRVRAEAQTRAEHSRSQGLASRDKSRFTLAVVRERKSKAEAHGGKQRSIRDERIDKASGELREAKARAREDEIIRIDLPETETPEGKLIMALRRAEGLITVQGPERIVVSGRNGAGKTTLLRALVGRSSLPGMVVERIVRDIGYLPQRLDFLDDRLNVMENLLRSAPGLSRNQAHSRLAQFLLKGDRVRQPAGSLSGGERFRLALACVLSADPPPQLLLLDEPTNNLDLASVAELVSALNGFRGALLTVSHDRRFLADIGVTREWTMANMAIAGDVDWFAPPEKQKGDAP